MSSGNHVFPCTIVSGSGSNYKVKLDTGQIVNARQLQIDPSEKIPAGVQTLAFKNGEDYYLNVPVWLPEEPATPSTLADGLGKKNPSNDEEPDLANDHSSPVSWKTRCNGALRCSSDCGTICRGNEIFTLSSSQQACLSFVIDAWENGRRMFTNKELLEAAGSTGDYIRDVFRSNGKSVPIWGNLLVQVPNKKGFYTLQLSQRST